MRKIILFDMITLNGYFEGKGSDLSWHNVDEEFNRFAVEQLQSADILFFGRVTYEMMASYWPESPDDDPVKDYMNRIDKYVFSKSLEKADWQNTKVINKNSEKTAAELRQQEGKDIYVFGSSNLSCFLIDKNLVDEFRIMVNPVLIGKGISIFNKVKNTVKLTLTGTKIFNSGNVLLYYKVDGQKQ